MQTKIQEQRRPMTWAALLATVMTAVVVIVRVVLTPGLRDWDTGHFSVSGAVIFLVLITLVVLACLMFLVERQRVDVRGVMSLPLGLSAIVAGLALGIRNLWDLYGAAVQGRMPAPAAAEMTTLSGAALYISLLFGILGGVSLVLWGLQIASEGGTHIGMRAWSALLPVLWTWFRLARYEMSYASAVDLKECFYDFVMLIMEMLFLFKLARYVSGIGNTHPGMMMFYSLGTAITAISCPVTRLCVYLLGDMEAYLSSKIAGIEDFAVGLLALVFAWALVRSAPLSAAQEKKDAEDAAQVSEEDEQLIFPENNQL